MLKESLRVPHGKLSSQFLTLTHNLAFGLKLDVAAANSSMDVNDRRCVFLNGGLLRFLFLFKVLCRLKR